MGAASSGEGSAMRIDSGDPAAARLALLWAVGLLLALPAAAAASPMAIQPLLGPSVGDAEALRNEGKRLYNRREYREAAAVYLRANRADASHPGTYLNLARARLAADELPSACSAYRAYLRFAPKGSDRG